MFDYLKAFEVRSVFRGMMTAIAIASLIGCGGGDSLPPPRKSVAEDEETAATVTAVAATTPVTPKEETKPEPSGKMIAGAGRALANQDAPSGKPRTAEPRQAADDEEEDPTTKGRPNDPRLWTPDDFRTAKRDNDPRLVRAVTDWAATQLGDEAAGQLLVELLTAPGKSAPAESATFNVESSSTTAALVDDDGFPIAGTNGDRRPNPQLAEACVAALGVNNSAAARTGLRRALLGTLATDLNDKRLVEAALKALATNRNPKNENVLLTVLTKAEKVRPTLVGEMDASALQEACLKQVRSQSSAAFRRSIAVEMAAGSVNGVFREHLIAWLMATDFVNLPAQCVAYGHRNCELETRRKLERIFAPYGQDVLLELLTRSAAEQQDSLSDRSAQVAAEFYSRDFTAALAERVRRVDGLAADRDLLNFAARVPAHEVRAEMAQLLKRRWTSGAKEWDKAQVNIANFLDPGLLLAVKAVPREDTVAHRSPLGDKAVKPKLEKSNNPEVQRFQAEKVAKEEWMTATEDLVKAISERLRAASQGALATSGATAGAVFTEDCAAQSPDDTEASRDAATGPMPLALPASARVISEFHLEWPRQWPTTLGTASAPEMVIHYARLEQEERVSTVQAFFRRQLKRPESRFIKRGNWVESVEHVSDSGRLRSVDVMILRTTDTPPSDRTAKEPLIVDVLWIEVPDFTR